MTDRFQWFEQSSWQYWPRNLSPV